MADANANHAGPDHLVLSCMDYRHMDDLVRELHKRFGRDDAYDHLILAGASLGVVQQVHPAWRRTFWTHLEVAMKLHPSIRHVWLVEHAECGAYREFLGKGAPVPQEEFLHRSMATLLKDAVAARAKKRKWPIDVSTFIMRPGPVAGVWRLDDLKPLDAG
jgi:hypothetical protein